MTVMDITTGAIVEDIRNESVHLVALPSHMMFPSLWHCCTYMRQPHI